MCYSLSCGLVLGVTESTFETENIDSASEKEDDSQAKSSKTSRNLVEERFLRIRYDCDLSTQKLSSTQELSSTPQGEDKYSWWHGGGDLWSCPNCGAENPSWQTFCPLC